MLDSYVGYQLMALVMVGGLLGLHKLFDLIIDLGCFIGQKLLTHDTDID